VIVVDDDPGVREALGALMKSAQLNAAVFASAEDALASGLFAHASCLISDLRMPGMQGMELRRVVKREYPELPVLFITAHREDGMKSASVMERADRLFYKPLDPRNFLQAVETAISDASQGT
jgi:FixJ family two-component response regulator